MNTETVNKPATPEAGQARALAVAPGSASGNATIRIALTLEYDPAIMHGDDEDAKAWFFDSILQPGDLFLHSNEIGDVVGEIKSIEILPNVQMRDGAQRRSLDRLVLLIQRLSLKTLPYLPRWLFQNRYH